MTCLDGELLMKRLLALAFLVSGVATASAQSAPPAAIHTSTAGDLAEICGANSKEPAGVAKINYCHGFAQGAVDVELRRAGDKKPFCFPSPAPSRSATMSEFVGWVRSMPENRRLSAVDGLFRFLAQRFPCK